MLCPTCNTDFSPGSFRLKSCCTDTQNAAIYDLTQHLKRTPEYCGDFYGAMHEARLRITAPWNARGEGKI